MTDLLNIERLSIAFGPTRVVDEIDLAIGPRETLALVGESGSGKSATALSIVRLNPRQARLSGRILFEGRDLLSIDDRALRDIRGGRISMIFQEPMVSLNPVLTIGEQVAEILVRHKGITFRAARREALELLDLVKLPKGGHIVDRYPHNLSGGQRQRVMIAIAVACRPRLLIADEPTTALDVVVQADILQLLDGLKRELGMSLLLITHDLRLVSQWADRVSVMHGGKLLEQGQAANVLSRPAHSYTRGLLGASLPWGDRRHYSRDRLPEVRKSIDADDGTVRFDLVVPPLRSAAGGGSQAASPAPLLSVSRLRVTYPGRRGREVVAVDDVSFEVAPGETLGIVGESGCGKSTLSKALVGIVAPSAGKIGIDGAEVAPSARRWFNRAGKQPIRLIFQDPYGSLNPRQSVGQMLDLMQRLSGVRDGQVRRREAALLIERVGLPASALDRYPHEFSGGQRQRIGIARALIQRPKLIICDEPVSALDVSIQAQILNLLSELKAEYGLSYLFISHDLGVVRYFADRVAVMRDGRFVEEGTSEDIWRDPKDPYTRRLIASVPGGTGTPHFAPAGTPRPAALLPCANS